MSAPETPLLVQRVDYGASVRSAEEAVNGVIDLILAAGGQILFQKYLERKAFSFASQSACNVAVSSLQMCYVAHDQGEADIDEEDEDWGLEEEPLPASIDCWARMHLQVRKPKTKEELIREGKAKVEQQQQKERRQRELPRSGRMSEAVSRRRQPRERSESRNFPIVEDILIDEEEERYREQKVTELQQRREREVKAKETERLHQEDVKKNEAMAEEMSKRPHTYDLDGNIIWIDDVKPEKLPKVHEVFNYTVKRDPKQQQTQVIDPAAGGKKEVERGKKTGTRKRTLKGGTGRDRHGGDPEFTDSFSRLQHGQPPVLDTMVVKPGVVLESQGKTKAGAMTQDNRQMSRKEYLIMTEREVATFQRGGQGSAADQEAEEAEKGEKADSRPPTASRQQTQQGGEQLPISVVPPAAAPSGGPTAPASGAQAAGQSAAAGAPPAQGGTGAADSGAPGGLPKLDQGRGLQPGAEQPPFGAGNKGGGRLLSKAAGAPAAAGGMPFSPARAANLGGAGGMYPATTTTPGSKGGQVQKAPIAPAPHLRNQKFDSLGYVARPPRFHVAPLGGPFGIGAPQPPLGATMGHGLMRDRSLKEAYFFPSNTPPEMASPLLRSASEVIRPSSGPMISADGRSGRAGEDIMHGRIIPDDKTNAYRSVQHILGSDDGVPYN